MRNKLYGYLLIAAMVTATPAIAATVPDYDLQVGVVNPGAHVSIARVVEDGKLVVSVEDAQEKPLLGLQRDSFTIMRMGQPANVTSVQQFSEEFDVPLNFVLIFDNSDSMRERNAIEPLKAAAGELLKSFRPIDRVSIVVFDKKDTMSIDGQALHVKMLHSNDPAEIREFLANAYSGKQITYETWLYEAMLAGYDLLKKIPEEEQKFMVVFSDGDDNASAMKLEAVEGAAKSLPKFGAYAIDFMPKEELMPALQGFVEARDGQIWKADDNASLAPIFKEVATDFNRYYVVNYIFPPTGDLAVKPGSLTIEEVKTLDASPMLGHIYFDEGASEIPDRYIALDLQQVADFNEPALKDTLEKYYQVLNILGKRMQDNPEAMITLVGCNANKGGERGNLDLSMARAVAVQEYLQSTWDISPDRVMLEARNLPEMPSTSRIDEGQADNRRVEVQTDSREILDLIRSAYITYKADTSMLTAYSDVGSVYGIARWDLSVANNDGLVAGRNGEGDPPNVMVIALPTGNLDKLAVGGDLKVSLSGVDAKGQTIELTTPPVEIDFIQTRKLTSEKQDYLVQEKYALILFSFDSDEIGGQNQAIVAEIVKRIRELPEATVAIVGHSDNIGKDDYNLKLSERRAKAVYDQIIEMYGDEKTERITHMGVGAAEPLYENVSPETRAFNRTVTITLEYTEKE